VEPAVRPGRSRPAYFVSSIFLEASALALASSCFSLDDAADVGMDEGTPVVEDYQPRDSKFTGTIKKVLVEVGAMGAGDKAAAKKAGAEAARKLEETK